MSNKSAIEWTDATWNPVTGCSKVSAGCTNCYAEKVSHRFGWTDQPWNAAFASENVKLHPERLDQPLRWKKPRRVFVNSMSDLFHEQVPFEFILSVWARMAITREHTFQVLTKRPQRAVDFFAWMEQQEFRVEASLPNVWLGVSVENQQAADERIPLLLQTPAAVRFLSCEPLLGPVDLSICVKSDAMMVPVGMEIDWVIVGGESGPGARPMHPDWARALRDQCAATGVAFFFKQWGEFVVPLDELPACRVCGCTEHNACPEGCWWIEEDLCSNCDGLEAAEERPVEFERVGKKAAGRVLDDRTWDEFPVVQ